MGCIQNKRRPTKIVAMKTVNEDVVFTSTSNIRSIYTFEKILGHGSFGIVKLARLKSNAEKQVAVKIIDKNKVKGKESMLATEIYILQRLDHPNIIKFYEVYQDELFLYICMEYCEGGELLERIAKSSKILTEGQTQQIINKIISAVAFIHDEGIVHRDIKPENIMFSQKNLNSEPKLIDFGLSNKFDISHFKKLKTFVGTPIYLPPEIIEGDYDEKCDVWSLGVLLYVLLCGVPPFYGKNKNQLFNSIQTAPLIFDSKNWKNKSDLVKDLIRKMLQKSPNKRISARQALSHPWFKIKFQIPQLVSEKSTSKLFQTQKTILQQNETDENKHILNMLKNFRSGAKFKKEVTKVLINQMNELDLNKLKEAFQKIDVDQSGTITVEELEKAMQEQGFETSKEEIEKLVQTIVLEEDEEDEQYQDNPKPLLIKYTDFLAAAIDERKVFTREKLWSVFKYFDMDGSHFITKENIREAFARHGRTISEEKIEEMIYEIDPNHDEKITFEEFCAMMGVEGIEQTLEIKD